jgi:hypothetical protein
MMNIAMRYIQLASATYAQLSLHTRLPIETSFHL